MTQQTELLVQRGDLRATKIVQGTLPAPDDGEVQVAIDKFGLTANNVTYAVAGDMIGYWQFYPAEDNWGKVPVWGFGDVIASNCEEVPVGERLWGFFPMASHALLRPGRIKKERFTDVSEHREDLPAVYNNYSCGSAEPEAMQGFETERCLLFPLFATSFLLCDYLTYNDFFGASQVLIGSVSSKTGFGMAQMLRDSTDNQIKVVGLTSAGNRDFVLELGCCDQVVLYGDEDQIDTGLPSAYVDMSGNGGLASKLHSLLGENMKASIMVGATHWEAADRPEGLPGAQPEFFFAPAHIATREKEWGPGVAMSKAMDTSLDVAATVKDQLQVDWLQGAEALQSAWLDMLDNKLPASRALMVSLLDGAE